MISEDNAFELVRNTSKFPHASIVSAIMGKLAARLGEDKVEWKLVGLLHDLDYDEVRGDMSKHGVVAAERLKGKLPANCLHAIKAHDYRTGFKPMNRLDSALIAVDSLSTLIERAQMQRQRLDDQALKDILTDISEKEPWHKTNINMCKEIGLRLDEFLKLGISSLQSLCWLGEVPFQTQAHK